MSIQGALVSVVVPVFNSYQTLGALVSRVGSLRDKFDVELILVDDGSTDSSWETIEVLVATESFANGIKLSRNFGQHNALLAGIRAARGKYIVTLDDDLQFAPEDVPSLLEKLEIGNFDVVYGSPLTAKQSFPRRFGSKFLKKILKTVMGVEMAGDLSAFRIFKTSIAKSFELNVGPNVSIDALLTWATSNVGNLGIVHHKRNFGASNYTLRKLIRHATDIVTSYSVRPLKLSSLLGVTSALIGFILLATTLVQKIFYGLAVPGFTFLASSILLFSGIQLLVLGVFGEYLARMHFRVMNRPSYFISQRTNDAELDWEA